MKLIAGVFALTSFINQKSGRAVSAALGCSLNCTMKAISKRQRKDSSIPSEKPCMNKTKDAENNVQYTRENLGCKTAGMPLINEDDNYQLIRGNLYQCIKNARVELSIFTSNRS